MFGQNMFSGQQNPLVDLQQLQQLQRQQQAQIQQYNQLNIVNPPSDKFTELQNKLSKLSNDEKMALQQEESFVIANQQYEQGLLGFIAAQFRQQFNNSADGIKLIDNLSTVLDTSLTNINSKYQEEKNQLKEIAELLKNNPELIKQLKDGKKQ